MLQSLNQTGSDTKFVVVMGCGRVGASIAASLSEAGHAVHILDVDSAAFDHLPPGMVGTGHVVPILGDGTLEADLRKASTQDADVFIAVAAKDTYNAIGAQLAKHILQVPTVICRMNDPTREEMYSKLGLITVSATKLVTEMARQATVS